MSTQPTPTFPQAGGFRDAACICKATIISRITQQARQLKEICQAHSDAPTQHLSYSCKQRRNVGLYCLKHKFGIKLEITMSYMVAHSYYGLPWHFREFRLIQGSGVRIVCYVQSIVMASLAIWLRNF